MREFRRVPKDWQHPRYTVDDAPDVGAVGQHKPLRDGRELARDLQEWDEAAAQWERGFVRAATLPHEEVRWEPRDEDASGTYAEWDGDRPDPNDYTPNWPESERTHWMMYHSSSGTPASPAFESIEPLARWLANHREGNLPDAMLSYEQWLTILRSSQPGLMVLDGFNTNMPSAAKEQFARWLADHKKSVFPDAILSYEQWLDILHASPGVIVVEDATRDAELDKSC